MGIKNERVDGLDPVGELLKQLEKNPSRFRATGGYERLLDLLREGHAPDALKIVLQGDTEVAGDLLWTIAELEIVSPFVFESMRHLSNPDIGTAAYAMEIVLRGSQDQSQLRTTLQQLNVCDVAVCEHAVRTLAGEGLARLIEILDTVGWTWTTVLGKELSSQALRRQVVEGLVSETSRDRQVLGLVLATLAFEQDPGFAKYLTSSKQAWIREYGEWLEQGLKTL